MNFENLFIIIFSLIVVLEVKILLFLITAINIVTMMLYIFIDIAFAEQNDAVVIEKPKWCNSANLSNYYTFGEFQEEYKYPCATYI
jgi:hypothetical protein